MKSTLPSLGLIFALGSCVASYVEPQDVTKNRQMNTEETHVVGKMWEITLPPNYKVIEHELDEVGIETLKVKSRFLVGERDIRIEAFAVPLHKGMTREALYSYAQSGIEDEEGWSRLYGPETMMIGKKEGIAIVGTTKGPFINAQFTFVSKGNGYVLRCRGDANAKTKVLKKCHGLVDRFKEKEGK